MDPFAVHDQAGRPLGDLHTLAREFEDSVVIQNSESDSEGSNNNLSSDSGSDNGGNAARKPLTTHDLEKMLAAHQAIPTPAAAKQKVATDKASSSSYESANHGNEVDEEAKPSEKDRDSEEERVLQRNEATDDDRQEDGLSASGTESPHLGHHDESEIQPLLRPSPTQVHNNALFRASLQ